MKKTGFWLFLQNQSKKNQEVTMTVPSGWNTTHIALVSHSEKANPYKKSVKAEGNKKLMIQEPAVAMLSQMQ